MAPSAPAPQPRGPGGCHPPPPPLPVPAVRLLRSSSRSAPKRRTRASAASWSGGPRPRPIADAALRRNAARLRVAGRRNQGGGSFRLAPTPDARLGPQGVRARRSCLSQNSLSQNGYGTPRPSHKLTHSDGGSLARFSRSSEPRLCGHNIALGELGSHVSLLAMSAATKASMSISSMPWRRTPPHAMTARATSGAPLCCASPCERSVPEALGRCKTAAGMQTAVSGRMLLQSPQDG